MSAKIDWKQGTSVSSEHKIGKPDWAIRHSSPMVFRMTVLPPAFGPLRMSARCSPSITTSFEVTAAGPDPAFCLPTNRGCLAALSLILLPVVIVGITPSYSKPKRALAEIASMTARAAIEFSIPSASLRSSDVSSLSILQPLPVPPCAVPPAGCSARARRAARQKGWLANLIVRARRLAGSDENLA